MKLFYKKINILNKGFTLVETLVAISIFTLSMVAVLSVLVTSISNTSYAKRKMVASYLAQEGIEYVRNMRDNYVLYPESGKSWVSFKDANKDYPITGSDFAGYIRLISMQNTSANEVKIISDVSWMQGSGTYHIIFSENLYNWQ